MLPSIQFIKEWQSSLSCRTHEFIYDLRSNHRFLAIIISNGRKDETRLELRSPMTFQQQWTLYFISDSEIHRFPCCALLNNQWLIMDPLNSQLLHISDDGIFIQQHEYNPVPYHAVQINEHLIAVSAKKTVYPHQLS